MKYPLIILSSLYFMSCAQNYEEDLIIDTGTEDSTEQVSYSSDITPILESRCTSCHNNISSNGGVNLASYATTINTVVPNDSEQSILYGVVAHTFGSPMPQGDKLPDNQIEVIKIWIDEGALDN